jgi:hypothetical protein
MTVLTRWMSPCRRNRPRIPAMRDRLAGDIGERHVVFPDFPIQQLARAASAGIERPDGLGNAVAVHVSLDVAFEQLHQSIELSPTLLKNVAGFRPAKSSPAAWRKSDQPAGLRPDPCQSPSRSGRSGVVSCRWAQNRAFSIWVASGPAGSLPARCTRPAAGPSDNPLDLHVIGRDRLFPSSARSGREPG